MAMRRLSLGVLCVASLISVVCSQDACDKVTTSDLGDSSTLSTSGLIATILSPAGQGTNIVAVRILEMNIVCEAQHMMENKYRYTSVVVSFNCETTDARVPECMDNTVVHTEQFDLGCGSGTWTSTILTLSDRARTTNPTATLTTMLNSGCILCINPNHTAASATVDSVTHCEGCTSCPTGLQRCYYDNSNDEECCNFFHNGACVTDCPSAFGPNADFECVLLPTISVQPASREVAPGGIATFSVEASGGEVLTFQWSFNNNLLSNTPGKISGADENILHIINVQQSDVGDYLVRVSNAAGFVDSNVVQLSLLDPPQFNVLSIGNVYQFLAPENSGGSGESLGTVTCTGPGGGALNGPVTYSILDPGSVPFTLDNSTGVLTLRNGQVLDYEQNELYTFDVSCSYVSHPSNSATAIVRFSVLPVNEFEAEPSDSSLIVTISESNPPGTILVSRDSSGVRQYSVRDDDRGFDGEVRFLSVNNNPPGFELNEMTGALRLTESIDLDSGVVGLLRITYTILVCDGDRPRVACNSLDVIVLVRSINDNPPVFEQDVYTVTIPETTPVNVSLITVVCTDADRHSVGEFSGITVDPADAPVFIPNERNGTTQVFLREMLDFERASTVTISIVCSDSEGLQATASLVINITPENDHPPVFNNTFDFSVDRISIIGHKIGEIRATDRDGNELTYTIIGSGSENFLLRTDGTLVLNDFILVLEGSFFELTVEASDGTFNTRTTVRITVDGILSIPEIIIVAVSGLIFIALVIIFVVIFCCCFIGCYRCLPEKKRTDSAEDMIGMDELVPVILSPPAGMYDHIQGDPYQVAQNPQHMADDQWPSQEMLDGDEGDDEPDIVLSGSVSYTPNTLKEVVEIFHEGDKVLDGKKEKKDKKLSKKQDKKQNKKQDKEDKKDLEKDGKK